MNRPVVEVLWLCILVALCIIMGSLLISGGILLYLVPRMSGIVWFGFAVLVLLSVHQVYRTVKSLYGHHDGASRLYGLVFAVPVLLMITVPPNDTTPQQLPNTGLVMQQGAAAPERTQMPEKTVLPTHESEPDPVMQPEEPEGPNTRPDPQIKPQGLSEETPCALVDGLAPYDPTQDSFADCLYLSNDEIKGQIVTLSGFVYMEDSFPANTLLVARHFISCCVADASLVGFHVLVEDVNAFEQGEWIMVTGTVTMMPLEYYGEIYDFPILTNGSVMKSVAPSLEDRYIYP